ncbi:conjugal transfer protein TraD [Sphingomonas sp. Root710]|nr:conjugal transfer protein TraD [Sphingomonas sp. Root710]KRB81080.1 conjugal transfer protein TraD [Sphingomonas sp. Root710]
MRKVRDFDAELKALNDRAKLLKQRKIQQFGELIEATGADALEPDLLAGALLAVVAETDKAVMTKWSARGAQFFRETSRRPSRRADSNDASGKAAETGTEPA